MNLQEKCLTMVDEEINEVQLQIDEDDAWTSQSAIDDANKHLGFLRALRSVISGHGCDEHGWCEQCWYPDGTPVKFPCFEIRGIARELGIDE